MSSFAKVREKEEDKNSEKTEESSENVSTERTVTKYRQHRGIRIMDKENAATNVRRRSGSSASGRSKSASARRKTQTRRKTSGTGVKLPEVLI